MGKQHISSQRFCIYHFQTIYIMYLKIFLLQESVNKYVSYICLIEDHNIYNTNVILWSVDNDNTVWTFKNYHELFIVNDFLVVNYITRNKLFRLHVINKDTCIYDLRIIGLISLDYHLVYRLKKDNVVVFRKKWYTCMLSPIVIVWWRFWYLWFCYFNLTVMRKLGTNLSHIYLQLTKKLREFFIYS